MNDTTSTVEIIEEMELMLKDKFNRFVGFDTVGQSKIIADFLNKNKELLKINAIERRANLGQHTLTKLISGESKTIHPNSAYEVLSILKRMRFEMPKELDDDDFNIPVEGFTCELAPVITIERIQKIVCKYYNIPITLLSEETRDGDVVKCRQIIWYFSKILLGITSRINGEFTGNKKHCTVLYAIKTVNNLIDTDKKYAVEIDELEKQITR